MSVENSRFTQFLLAAAATGFIAWAGVVWSTGDRLQVSINLVITKLGVIEERISNMQTGLSKHEALPWHGDVGLQIERLRRE